MRSGTLPHCFFQAEIHCINVSIMQLDGGDTRLVVRPPGQRTVEMQLTPESRAQFIAALMRPEDGGYPAREVPTPQPKVERSEPSGAS